MTVRAPQRFGIDKRDALAVQRQLAGEMKRERRFADTAFLIEQSDDHRFPPGLRPKGSDGWSS